MAPFFKRKIFPYLLFLLAAGLTAGVELYQISGQDSAEECVRVTEKKIKEVVRQMQAEVERSASIGNEEELGEFYSAHARRENGVSYYCIERRQVIYWSNLEPVFETQFLNKIPENGPVHLPNGWFYLVSKKAGSRIFAGLLLLKHDYAYENKYLKNEFNPELGLPLRFRESENGAFVLHGPQGESLFRISEPGKDAVIDWSTPAGLEFAAMLLAILASALIFHRMLKVSLIKTLAVLVLLAGYRFLMIYYQFPEELYRTLLFSPRIYASSFYFNSLGDLLLNALLFAGLAISLYSYSSEFFFKSKWKIAILSIWLLGSVIAAFFLIRGLVLNSRISFDLAGFSGLEVQTILALSGIALGFIGLFLLSATWFRVFFRDVIKSGHVVVALVFCAFFTAGIISVYHSRKEQETRKLLAHKVDVRRDHVAEYIFEESLGKISRDTSLRLLMQRKSFQSEDIKSYLAGTYFKGYLSKFDFNLYAYDEDGIPLDSSRTPVSLNYFKQQVRTRGVATSSGSLHFIPTETGRLTYLGIVPVQEVHSDNSSTLVLTLETKFFRSESGFPELFMTGTAPDNSDLGEYSIARYSQGELIYEYGNFSYSFSSQELGDPGTETRFVKVRNYDHMLYPVKADTFIVISRPAGTYLTLLTLFSWIFAWFSLVALVSYLLFRFFSRPLEMFRFNLTRRIQTAVIFLVLLSFVLIGSGTVVYIFRKYDEDQARSIREQMNGLWFLLNNNFGFTQALSKTGVANREDELNELVNNLNLDFNLYTEKGRLYYSSQPKIFNQQVVSERMHPHALFAVRDEGRTQFIQPENIGSLRFISAYAPFTDRNGKITAYLNLPYFEKQNERDREVSGFLSALINIYVILFALSVLITLFISSRITKPLLLIQERLSALRLGKRNEPIPYHRKDEIGQLVLEYNRMVDELAISATRLAESERESAWREMAKQVAHEIKNPLTPMKLSIQHMQRAWKEDREDKEQILERMAKTLISQIETLSNIATEFSNFAKMPEARITTLDLRDVIEATIELFRDTPSVSFVYEEPEEAFLINADREQYLRVLSNLVKNAIQAIPVDRPGLIHIKLSDSGPGHLLLTIQDNGTGITEDQRDKIFKPNFTTKSSGMGLGLSLVKNIVLQSGGTITYSTVYGEGTSFLVRLPRVEKSV